MGDSRRQRDSAAWMIIQVKNPLVVAPPLRSKGLTTGDPRKVRAKARTAETRAPAASVRENLRRAERVLRGILPKGEYRVLGSGGYLIAKLTPEQVRDVAALDFVDSVTENRTHSSSS